MSDSDPKIMLGIQLGELKAGLVKAGVLVKDFKGDMSKASVLGHHLAGAVAAIGGQASIAGAATSQLISGLAIGGEMGLAIGGVLAIIEVFKGLREEEKKATEEAKKQAKERKEAYDKAAEALYNEQTALAKKRYVAAGGTAEQFAVEQAPNEDLALQKAQLEVNLAREALQTKLSELKVEGYSKEKRVELIKSEKDRLDLAIKSLAVEEQRLKTSIRTAGVDESEANKKAREKAEDDYRNTVRKTEDETAAIRNRYLSDAEKKQYDYTVEVNRLREDIVTEEKRGYQDSARELKATLAAKLAGWKGYHDQVLVLQSEADALEASRRNTAMHGADAAAHDQGNFAGLDKTGGGGQYETPYLKNALQMTQELTGAFATLGATAGAAFAAMAEGNATALDAMKAVLSQMVQIAAQLFIQIQLEAAKAAVIAGGSAAATPFIGLALGVSAAAAMFSAMMAYKPSARMFGGWVGADMPYMVGEAGPELFVPKSTGDIIPHDKLAGSNVFHVYAHDARSFAEYLRDNRLTVVRVLQGAVKDGVY